MRFTVAVLTVALALSAQAQARPSARAQPSAESMREHTDAPATVMSENAEAYARQQAFDARIARRTQRAAQSICQGCGQGNRPNTHRQEADADDSALRTDPAQAPLD